MRVLNPGVLSVNEISDIEDNRIPFIGVDAGVSVCMIYSM